MGRNKQDLVKTPEIHHNLSKNLDVIIFWRFQQKPRVFEQDIKHKEENHSIMSLGASLIWNNFWTKIYFFYFFANRLLWAERYYEVLHSGKKWEKSLEPFSKKFQKPHVWPLSPDFKKMLKSLLVPYYHLNLCKKSEKSLEQILRKRCY